MKVNIVTCFESNEERVTFIMDSCISLGLDAKVYTTDFSHIRKEKRNNILNGFIGIETKPYNNNLSIQRLLSHKDFSEKVFKEIEKNNPDLIWIEAPCLSLIKEANNYKKNHSNIKVIIDIIDMWPESLPLGNIKNLLPFRLWKNIRKRNISCADYVVTECDLYQDILKNEYKGQMSTIHWARDAKAIKSKLNLPEDKLSLAYIGSINNIIDINLIKELISTSNKQVELHIIGNGENKDLMINTLKEVCDVIYHGSIYDTKEKQEIFSKCHAGINIYREGLYIGLTVKCIDYFMYGLPIINNIKGDTWKFVEKNKVGINVNSLSKLNVEELINMRLNNDNVYELFNSNFTKEIFINKCKNVINKVIK